jgi:glutamine phosphoribosylpyrophosphate amidotransferase
MNFNEYKIPKDVEEYFINTYEYASNRDEKIRAAMYGYYYASKQVQIYRNTVFNAEANNEQLQKFLKLEHDLNEELNDQIEDLKSKYIVLERENNEISKERDDWGNKNILLAKKIDELEFAELVNIDLLERRLKRIEELEKQTSEILVNMFRQEPDLSLAKEYFVDCVYPDNEGGHIREKHTKESFDKDGFCNICGLTIDQVCVNL